MANTYAYQVDVGDSLRHMNPKYEITAFFPGFQNVYPFLVGMAVLGPQSLFTLVMGQLADRFNRVYLFAGFSILWSLMTIL